MTRVGNIGALFGNDPSRTLLALPASPAAAPLDGLYCDICNPCEYELNYPAMRLSTCVTSPTCSMM